MKLRPTLFPSKKTRSKRSEKQLAKEFGGQVQPGSGCLPVSSLKGDVKTDHWLFDDKTTQAKSFGVSSKLWLKLEKEAWQNRRKPALRIVFENEGLSLYVIGNREFHLLNEHLKNESEDPA